MDKMAFFQDVKENVEAYQDFLRKQGATDIKKWEDIPLTTKQTYLLNYPIEKAVRKGNVDKCSLIGASSGFSKTGSVYWLKGPEDEERYLGIIEETLKALYGIDERKTLIVTAAALGMWFGGMQLACFMRSLASRVSYPLTAALPGLDLEEAAHVVKRFFHLYDQILFITNASNVSILYSLLKDEPKLLNGTVYFAVVGEYFSENYRRNMALRFGHDEHNEVVVWTGYGSADTGDIAMETRETIRLRKYFEFESKELSRKLFQTDDTPMIMKPFGDDLIEIIEGQIVVTKDQLIPLVRYNTKDRGGVLKKESLKGIIDEKLYESLPDKMLYIHGRPENSVIFYGTNLMINDIGNFFYSIEKEISYSGLFEVKKEDSDGVERFVFTVYTFNDVSDKKEDCKKKLIEFLKNYSKEFVAKYDNLRRATKIELIDVRLEQISKDKAATKHRFVKE